MEHRLRAAKFNPRCAYFSSLVMNDFDTSSRTSLTSTMVRLGRFLRSKINHELHGWKSMSNEFSDDQRYTKYHSKYQSFKSDMRSEYTKFQKEYHAGDLDRSISSAINTVSHSLDQFLTSGAKALDSLFGNQQPLSPEFQQEQIKSQMQLQHYRRIEKLEQSIAKSRKRMAWQGSFSVFFLVMSMAESEGFFAAVSFTLMCFTGFQALRLKKQKQELHHVLTSPMFGHIPPTNADTDIEKKILRHAHNNRGIVFPELMAVQSDLALSEIERILMQCLNRQLCTIEIDDSGRRYYYFASLDFSA